MSWTGACAHQTNPCPCPHSTHTSVHPLFMTDVLIHGLVKYKFHEFPCIEDEIIDDPLPILASYFSGSFLSTVGNSLDSIGNSWIDHVPWKLANIMRIYVSSCLEVLCLVTGSTVWCLDVSPSGLIWIDIYMPILTSKLPLKIVHASLQVNNYPTLFIYPAGDKSNPVCLQKQMQTLLVSWFFPPHVSDVLLLYILQCRPRSQRN